MGALSKYERAHKLKTDEVAIGGVDDSRRSSPIGDLIVALVAYPDGDLKELDKCHLIRDSKKLSPTQRREALDFIYKLTILRGWGIYIATRSAAEVTKDNLNELTLDMYGEVVRRAASRGGLIAVYADVVGTPTFTKCWIRAVLPEKQNKMEVRVCSKADDHWTVVSVASIVAQTVGELRMADFAIDFDRVMNPIKMDLERQRNVFVFKATIHENEKPNTIVLKDIVTDFGSGNAMEGATKRWVKKNLGLFPLLKNFLRLNHRVVREVVASHEEINVQDHGKLKTFDFRSLTANAFDNQLRAKAAKAKLKMSTVGITMLPTNRRIEPTASPTRRVARTMPVRTIPRKEWFELHKKSNALKERHKREEARRIARGLPKPRDIDPERKEGLPEGEEEDDFMRPELEEELEYSMARSLGSASRKSTSRTRVKIEETTAILTGKLKIEKIEGQLVEDVRSSCTEESRLRTKIEPEEMTSLEKQIPRALIFFKDPPQPCPYTATKAKAAKLAVARKTATRKQRELRNEVQERTDSDQDTVQTDQEAEETVVWMVDACLRGCDQEELEEKRPRLLQTVRKLHKQGLIRRPARSSSVSTREQEELLNKKLAEGYEDPAYYEHGAPSTPTPEEWQEDFAIQRDD